VEYSLSPEGLYHMKSSQPLTLFIIKQFYGYNGQYTVCNGLRVSAQFVVDLLLYEGHRAKLVQAIDGNSIDKLVSENLPAKVILEAIWVTPTKMAELQKLHPKVKWTVRVHSEIPFLANEGVAVEWIAAYIKQGIEVAFNSSNTANDFSILGIVSYLPNYYPVRKPRTSKPSDGTLDVGCFGAIRPLKNQLIQAFAAVKYAQIRKVPLIFHMNGSRIEQSGANNLRQIQALMTATGQTLVMHSWLDHTDFLELIATMDICLQVSLSESFNIVSADAVSMGVPLVGSESIGWLPELSQADVNSAESIVEAMERAGSISVALNQHGLHSYLKKSSKIWNKWATS
jgi:hypothetical protein